MISEELNRHHQYRPRQGGSSEQQQQHALGGMTYLLLIIGTLLSIYCMLLVSKAIAKRENGMF